MESKVGGGDNEVGSKCIGGEVGRGVDGGVALIVMAGIGWGLKAYLSMMEEGLFEELFMMDLQLGGKKVSLNNSICRGFFSGETIGAEE